MATIEASGARTRKRLIWAGAVALLLLPFAFLFVLAATDPEENIPLSRNEVAAGAKGERIWRGTFWNHSDSLYTDLDAVILFLDRDGKPLGQARGAARRLDPGEYFNLEAPLPREAVRIQMYQLRWTSYGNSVVLGPYRPWDFGYVQDARCDKTRLAIGSCTPQHGPDGGGD